MESIISAIIGAGAAVIACIINNNTLRAKTQHTIEMQVQQINANNEKNYAVMTERLVILTDQISKSDNERSDLIKRMYEVESEVERHGDRLSRLEEHTHEIIK